MCDKLVFDLAQEIEGSPNIFVKKDWINILDDQNGNYGSNQSIISTSQLSNSNKYMSYREAYLAIPMVMTLISQTLATAVNFVPATAGTSADYSIGLKNWFGQIVHSLTLDYNGTTIIQQTPYVNMWNSFMLMTSMSYNDILVNSASLGFYPDDPTTWSFETAASVNGVGTCNNTNYRADGFGEVVDGAFNNYSSQGGNIGFLKRQTYINFDPLGASGSAGPNTYTADVFNSASANLLWKSYVFNKVDGVNGANQGVLQIAVQAQVMLKHLHPFFQSIPLLKGSFMRLTMNLNNTTTRFSQVGGVFDLTSVANAVGGVNPVMVASRLASNGGVALGATTYAVNLSVGAVCLDAQLRADPNVQSSPLANSIFLYIPAYTFNPVFESSYISNAVKTINYTDIYQYNINAVPSGGQINQLLTNGIANIKSVLLLPYYAQSVANNTGLPLGVPVFQSPFDDAGTGPTSPLSLLTNFNCVVSGQNMIYNTQRYGYEQFMNQLVGQNGVNGNQTDGLVSGLVSQQDFEMKYCYYYVDVSRMLPVEESVPKSVQIIGQNTSVRAMDYFCFISYGVSISVDVLTGARV